MSKYKTLNASLVLALIMALLLPWGAVGAARDPAPGAPDNQTVAGDPAAAPKTSTEALLNPDGTLDLAGGFQGALDLDGWQVQMDPQRGPVLAAAAEPEWHSLGDRLDGAFNDTVYALAISGTDVYVGGWFEDAGGNPEADYVAHWDGSAWLALGSNGAGDGALSSSVYALAVSETGDVYVGGGFKDVSNNGTVIPEADYVAQWNGSKWSALGSNGTGDGALSSSVSALAVSGTDVYVGGGFKDAAGAPEADYVARWDGGTWLALGSNGAGDGALDGSVSALVVSGTVVYVGGGFKDVSNNGTVIPEADYVAQWDGSEWSALGSNGAGDGALSSYVSALAVSGTDVYVGGLFKDIAGDPAADYVARWDGGTWSALGSNGAGDGAIGGSVSALVVSGTDVYVGGHFEDTAGDPAADYVAHWDGDAWSALGSNSAGDGAIGAYLSTAPSVQALAVSEAGDVYVGGSFYNVNNNDLVDCFTKWDGSTWTAFGNDRDGALNDYVEALVIGKAGEVYVGGWFENADDNPAADYVAQWDGSRWLGLGSNGMGDGALDSRVEALAVGDTGELYVGGFFTDVAGIPAADYVAKWNGSDWSALGSDGAGDGALTDRVYALAVSGTDVYVGGTFDDVAGIPEADHIALWDGDAWSALGSNGAGDGALNREVKALAVSGTDVYVGGSFRSAAGNSAADCVAKWDGSAWSALGSDSAIDGSVYALAVSGTGEVYVGGYFDDAAGIPEADHIALWDGDAWSALGSNGEGDGVVNGGYYPGSVHALAISGTNVYVGGYFQDVDGISTADYIAKWDGSAWSALGSDGMGDGVIHYYVNALVVSGADVYMGGYFTDLKNNGRVLIKADFVARYGLPQPALMLEKTVAPAVDVPYHGTITYTLTLRNRGDLSDTHVVLTDALPDRVTFDDWVEKPSSGDLVRNGSAITWTGTLTANTTFDFTFSATHTGDYGDVITNIAYFSGTQQQGSASATTSITVYTLAIATAGDGSGVVTPTVGAHDYVSGTVVPLEATPHISSTFVGWSGDADCTDGSVMMDANKACTATFTLEPVCTALTGVTLTVPPASSLYVNAEVRLRADLAPDDATKPYTYTVDYGDGASDPASSSDDPLGLSHTWSSPGTHTVTVAAWNCAMTTTVTDTLAVDVKARTVYLPLVMRIAP